MEKRSGPSEHSGSPRDRERPPVQRGPRKHSGSPPDSGQTFGSKEVQRNTQAVPETGRDLQSNEVQENTQAVPQSRGRRSGPTRSKETLRQSPRPGETFSPREHSGNPRDSGQTFGSKERGGGGPRHSGSPRVSGQTFGSKEEQENTQAVPQTRGRRSGPRRSKSPPDPAETFGSKEEQENTQYIRRDPDEMFKSRRSKRTLRQTQGQEHSRNYGVLDGDVQSKRTLWSPGR